MSRKFLFEICGIIQFYFQYTNNQLVDKFIKNKNEIKFIVSLSLDQSQYDMIEIEVQNFTERIFSEFYNGNRTMPELPQNPSLTLFLH